jgi:hypothetical protein
MCRNFLSEIYWEGYGKEYLLLELRESTDTLRIRGERERILVTYVNITRLLFYIYILFI